MKTRSASKNVEDSKVETPKKNNHGLTITIPTPIKKSELEKELEKKKKDIFKFRTTRDKLVLNEHQIQPLKTSLLINKDLFPESLSQAKVENLDEIPSHRPIAKIAKVSNSLSPVTVLTPKGTHLQRVARFGSFSIFSNDNRLTTTSNLNSVDQIDAKSDFFESTPYQSIRETTQTEKKHKISITHHLLEQRRLAEKKAGSKRPVSQQKVMAKKGVKEYKASAGQYAYATEVFDKSIRWEWLHLVAYMLAGPPSQNSDNLVAGTKASNTEMMLAEKELNYLARVYPKGFELAVKATLIPETHIATKIEYTIKTPDFEIPIEFNPQTTNIPDHNYSKYFHFLVKELIICSQNAEKHKSDKASAILYSKKELKETPIATTESAQFTIPKRCVVIDTETTGLSVDEGDRVVEVGAIELLNGKPSGKEFRKLINPECDIPEKVVKIHNISNEVVENEPIFAKIADELIQFIKNAPLIGHNLTFDINMLENEFKIAGKKDILIGREAIDTLAEARKLVKTDSHTLSDLCTHFKINDASRKDGHGALIDAKLDAELLQKLKESQDKQKSTIAKQRLFTTPKITEEATTTKPAKSKLRK